MKKRRSIYGYKVGYQEIESRLFVRKFITKTYKRAYHVLMYYQKYGHEACKKKERERFNYSIKPITRKEYLAGIWNEIPFHIFPFVRCGYRRISQSQM